VSLAGPLLSATSSTITTNTDLIGVFNGATLLGGGSAPFVSLTGSTLSVGSASNNGDLLAASGRGGPTGSAGATATLAAGLLSLTGGSSSLTGGYALASDGGQIISTHASQPLVSIDGGSHSVATNSGTAAFRIFGQAANVVSETDSGTTLSLGTDQPLQHTGSGAFLEVKGGASVNGQRIVNLDTALLAASAPLLHLKSSSSMTTSVDALDLVQKAKLTSVGPVFKLDASTLTVNSGALALVRNGSLLRVTGDFLQLNNGSTLTLSSGNVINASGGSVVNISGALVNFGGTGGNVINVSSPTLCVSSCASFGGVNFLATNGATISISGTPIKNNISLGSINYVTGSLTTPAVIADGANTKVTISGF
jgi:hypothetical protein